MKRKEEGNAEKGENEREERERRVESGEGSFSHSTQCYRGNAYGAYGDKRPVLKISM